MLSVSITRRNISTGRELDLYQEVAGSIPASGSKIQMEALIMAVLGGWNIDEMKGCNLPQKAQSAFTAVTGGLVGADYQPVLYVGSQVVNGVNYCILAKQTIITATPEYRLVKVIVNVSPNGTPSLVSISGIAL